MIQPRELIKMSTQTGKVVGYVLFNTKSNKFVGLEWDGVPYVSDSIQDITIWEMEGDAETYRLTPGYEKFDSGFWIIHPLVLG